MIDELKKHVVVMLAKCRSEITRLGKAYKQDPTEENAIALATICGSELAYEETMRAIRSINQTDNDGNGG